MADMQKEPALVGIVPRKNLWSIIQSQRWYHIPIESAPKNAEFIKRLAFYFPKVFGKERQYKVSYHAEVLQIEAVKRIALFPDEPEHERAQKGYFKFHLGEIQKLPKPIPSKRWRRIVHIPTSKGKLFTAEEINDLYDTSPLEEDMYQEMKRRKIQAERQFYVDVGGRNYCLDFCIFCNDGNIDVECDGERYHILPDALARDRERNNRLTSYGWYVLRFSGREIRQSLKNCFSCIAKTIGTLGGSH